MSYEYPFDDDREVTVGDLRILQHTLLIMASLLIGAAVACMSLSLGIILDTLGEPLSGLYWIAAGVLLMGAIWVNVTDGLVRRFVGFFMEFKSPPLEDAKFGRENDTIRGDD